MLRTCRLLAGLALLALAVTARAGDQRRNPFGVEDVPDPYGEDVKQFAAAARLPGGPNDKNAAQWVRTVTEARTNGIDGEWAGRWEAGVGVARIKTVRGRVYVLYTDKEGQFQGRSWLLEAVREGNRLVGRWHQVGNPGDTGPYVGLIVNDERIDGMWGGGDGGRWDFRRRLK